MRRLLLAIALVVPFDAAAATLKLALQPVSVCTDAGCPPVTYGRAYFNRIMAQAGIEIRHLHPYATDALPIERDGFGALDPVATLFGFADAQFAAGERPGTAYMGFVPPLSGATVGIAFSNPPGLSGWPYGVVEPQGTRRFTSAIMAHEIGHILGAEHTGDDTLMNPYLSPAPYAAGNRRYLPAFATDTIAAMRASPLLQRLTGTEGADNATALGYAAVPVPPAAPLLLGGLLLLFRLRRG